MLNINLIDVINVLWSDRKKMCAYIAVAAVIGFILIFTTPRKYSSAVILAPEESGAGFTGSISSLASMIGMDMRLGQTGDAIYPEIYPDLVSSTDFVVNLFSLEVTKKDNSLTCDYYTYLKKHQQKSLLDYPRECLNALLIMLRPKEQETARDVKKTGPLMLSREQEEIVKNINGRIDCQVDKKTNVITIEVTDQDPLVAAQMADYVKENLQIAITNYRTKKARNDVLYMEKLFKESKEQYVQARREYASYADSNQEVNLQTLRMKEEDLENDMQLKYNIYQQIVEQLHLAKAKVQERTPAFTVMQSANVSNKPCGTPRIVTLAVWIVLGFMVRFIILAWKNKYLFLDDKNL